MTSRQEVLEVLYEIVKDQDSKALKWAVNYAKVGAVMILADMPSEDIKTQLLYVLNNITHWRGDIAKSARKTLKDFVMEN